MSSSSSSSSSIPSWATYDPKALGTTAVPYAVQNMVGGKWTSNNQNNKILEIPHPMDRDAFPIFTIPDTTDVAPFVTSLRQCPKTGLHNPLKNPERYLQYGEITRKVRIYCMNTLHVNTVPFSSCYVPCSINNNNNNSSSHFCCFHRATLPHTLFSH